MDVFCDDSSSDEENEQMSIISHSKSVLNESKKIREQEDIVFPAVRASEMHSTMNIFPKEFAPVYISSALRLVNDLKNVGGGRGIVAGNDLLPGELLLIEKPIIKNRGESIVELVELLAERAENDPATFSLLKLLHGGPSADGVFQCNAFCSGLYAFRSMFNDDGINCNCMQLVVPDTGLAEVWCFRSTKAGQPLTISYVQPMDCCTAQARAMYLSSHHDVHLNFPQLSPAQAQVENMLDNLDYDHSTHAALDALVAALDLLEENSSDTQCLRMRALRFVVQHGSIPLFRKTQDQEQRLQRIFCQLGLLNSTQDFLTRCSSSARAEVMATIVALAWLEALEKGYGYYHPDTGLAAAFAGDALDRAALSSPAYVLASLTGLLTEGASSLSTTAESPASRTSHAALLISRFSRSLHRRAEGIKALYDISRWLSPVSSTTTVNCR
mmetsp:Transcript_19632/g.25424  ORF Transcript_19632/g.25424 Transcript_19632/m.25424 type:complete len:442 (+) Transcript_19632:25-1350(+)